jgi:hypothetical protein
VAKRLSHQPLGLKTREQTMNHERIRCCIKGCCSSENKDLSPFTVSIMHDISWAFYAHDQCFISRCHPDVSFDNPEEHGNIPKHAKCVFCGDPLPIIGRHPYCFDIGTFVPPHRYWAHAQCMKAMVSPENWERPNTNSSVQRLRR